METNDARCRSRSGWLINLGKLRSVLVYVIGVFFVAIGIGLAFPVLPIQPLTVNHRVEFLAEPPLAAAFVAAYTRGDEVAASEVASPLYQAEWTRLGLSPLDRKALIPAVQSANASGTWIEFSYVGGASDGRGFGHLLYTAHPADSKPPSVPSAWRIDTDPRGRVIWAEMVYLYSDETTTLVPVSQDEDFPWLDPRSEPTQLRPRLITGVRTLVGNEGYYLAAMPTHPADPSSATSAYSIVFFGVDIDGSIRPGAWTYGQRNPGPSDYGHASTRDEVPHDPSVAALRSSYLDALCGGC